MHKSIARRAGRVHAGGLGIPAFAGASAIGQAPVHSFPASTIGGRTRALGENARAKEDNHAPQVRGDVGAASATLVAAPFVRTAGAAGNLTVGFWDHWVPGANTAMTEICEAWAEKEKVNLKIDYLSTQGNKLYLTIAAEALAKSGHDIMDFSAWEPSQYANSLEPVDDVMAEVLARNGPVPPALRIPRQAQGQMAGGARHPRHAAADVATAASTS